MTRRQDEQILRSACQRPRHGSLGEDDRICDFRERLSARDDPCIVSIPIALLKQAERAVAQMSDHFYRFADRGGACTQPS